MPTSLTNKGKFMSKTNPKIIKIEHFGYGFISNENALLLYAGYRHHYILMLI